MQEILSKEEFNVQLGIADSKSNQGQYDEALDLYEALLKKTEDSLQIANIYNKIANIYYNKKDFNNAILGYENLLKYRNGNASIFNMLGYLYFYKDYDKSIEYYLKGMEDVPDLKNFTMLTQVMIKSVQYSQRDLKRVFEKYIDYFRPHILCEAKPYTYNPKSFDRNKRLKIGYFSSDFYNHAMMSFVLPIIENHNREKFDIYLFNKNDKFDVVTQRLKNASTYFMDCSKMENSEIARTIHDAGIDILVDLSGYTHIKDAIWVLLYKPAPVIAQFLGFLGTYGMKEVDYIIADKLTIPHNVAKYYTEKPMYINGGMNKFAFQIPDRELPPVTPLPYEENGYITFGSFNAMSKINFQTVTLWSNVLKAVPNSKLLIYRTQMEQRDIDRFTKEFKQNGIDLNRIIFDKEPTPNSHMNSYLKCDIALDPIPFSGLTITIEQNFMGVPVLTTPGETIASKGTARVNKALGLKNFIAKNEKDYVKKAVKISKDIKKLRFLRNNLRQITEKSYICSGFKKYSAEFEKEYIKAWKKFCG